MAAEFLFNGIPPGFVLDLFILPLDIVSLINFNHFNVENFITVSLNSLLLNGQNLRSRPNLMLLKIKFDS